MENNISLDKLVLRRHQLYEQLEKLMYKQLAKLQEERLIDPNSDHEEERLHTFHTLVDQQESLKNEVDAIQDQIHEQLHTLGIASSEGSVYSPSQKMVIDSSQSLLEKLGKMQQQILELLKKQYDTLTSDMRKTSQHKQVMNSYYNINPNQQVAVYFDEKN